jgi:hypothetical protein
MGDEGDEENLSSAGKEESTRKVFSGRLPNTQKLLIKSHSINKIDN